jgi:hypothetical protein
MHTYIQSQRELLNHLLGGIIDVLSDGLKDIDKIALAPKNHTMKRLYRLSSTHMRPTVLKLF